MEFDYSGDTIRSGGGGNSALMGMLAGSALNRKDDDRGTYLWAVIIFAIIFIIAIIFLAVAFKDRPNEQRVGGGNDYAGLIATMMASKCGDNSSYKAAEFDKFEIMQKLEHNEDRARETQTQQEIGALGKEFAAMGFGISSKIDNVEKEQLKTYSTIQNQLGMQSMALQQLLTKQNNTDIINGVIQQLALGTPCLSKC